jgi:hypothetical protein
MLFTFVQYCFVFNHLSCCTNIIICLEEVVGESLVADHLASVRIVGGREVAVEAGSC